MSISSVGNRSRKRDIEQRVKLNFKASSKFAEYELWWPEQKRWLLKHHWLLDKYSIQADAKLVFTNRNKVLKGNRILTRSLTKIPAEHADMKNSSESELQFEPTCSIRISSRIRVKPSQSRATK